MKDLNIFYIFEFGLGQPEGFTHEPEIDSFRVQKNEPNPTRNANPIQPNPCSLDWVGLVVVLLNVHSYSLSFLNFL